MVDLAGDAPIMREVLRLESLAENRKRISIDSQSLCECSLFSETGGRDKCLGLNMFSGF